MTMINNSMAMNIQVNSFARKTCIQADNKQLKPLKNKKINIGLIIKTIWKRITMDNAVNVLIVKLKIMMKSKIFLIICCATLSVGCNRKDLNKENGLECAVITLEPSKVNLSNSYPATIKGKQDIEIRPEISGFITKLYIDEGSKVHKGQVLFQIDSVQYETAVRSAKAAVSTATANLETQEITVINKRALYQKNIISNYDLVTSENSFKSAKAELESANAQLISAEKNLSYTKVISPSDGIVGNIPFRVGSLVNSSDESPLTTVSDISEMYVYFIITEKDLLELIRENGSQKDVLATFPAVHLLLADGTLYPDSGKIETISGMIDQATGTVSVRATFPNTRHLLRSGGTGNILVPYMNPKALVIPQTATFEIQNKKFVYLLQPDSTVKMNEIKILQHDDGKNYIVTYGLNAGDQVVLDNANTLKDGQTIKVVASNKNQNNK